MVTPTLRTATIREFVGGWNLSDSDVNLATKYSRIQDNVLNSIDGKLKLRYGTALFGDVGLALTSSGEIVNMTYYNDFIVAVTDLGEIAAVNGQGVAYNVFDQTKARHLPGSPYGWGVTRQVSFAGAKNQLVIANGVDKPLKLDTLLRCQYLVDEGTGSNFNTPIGKFVVTHQDYLIVAGDPLYPAMLHIGAKGTVGTFVGDPAPNDAVDFDLGVYVQQGLAEIKGISSYRNSLIVFFPLCTIVVALGTYDADGKHIPNVADVIPLYGTVSHRSIFNIGDDMYFCDASSVPSFARALFTGGIKPDSISTLINPDLQKKLARLNLSELEEGVFSIYDKINRTYMMFVPDGNNRHETLCYAYTKQPDRGVGSWARLRGWNWKSACRSLLDNVFFSQGSKIYVYGNETNPVKADWVGEEQTFSDNTCFTDGHGWAASGRGATGVPIKGRYETPWLDFRQRNMVKKIRYIGLDTEGGGRFTVDHFVDRLYLNIFGAGEVWSDGTVFSDGMGWESEESQQLFSALSMEFIAGEGENGPFGGWRNTAREQLYGYPVSGKMHKLQFNIDTMDGWALVAYSLYYHQGSIYRSG